MKSPRYGALSYAWANVTATSSITVNGCDCFKVVESVHGALRQLRRRHIPTLVFVDAICINQANILERNVQVSMMGRIYDKADVVWLWLGSCGDADCSAKESESFDDGSPADRRRRDETVLGDASTRCNFLDTAFIDPAAKLQRTSWWWRTWTVPEVCLAQDVRVLLGPHRYSWRAFLDLLKARYVNGSSAKSTEAVTLFLERDHLRSQLRTMPDSREMRFDLYTLLTYTSHLSASDVRDIIYSLIRMLDDTAKLASDMNSWPITVDYATSPDELCLAATANIVQDDLDVLIDDWPRNMSAKPSWAVNFMSVRRSPSSLLVPSSHAAKVSKDAGGVRRRGYLKELYCAGRHESGDISFIDQLRLRISGVNFGTVSCAVAKTMWQDRDLLTLKHLSASDHQPAFGDVTPNSWQSDVQQRLSFERTVTADDSFTDVDRQYYDFSRPLDDTTNVAAKEHTMVRFEKQALHVLRGRGFFTTDQGYCGVGDATVRIGDIVAVFLGCSMPVVLRPSLTVDQYTLIGECFISGLMYGGVRHLVPNFKVMVQDFVLI